VTEPESKAEPPDEEPIEVRRVLSNERPSMSYEMVERGPAVSAGRVLGRRSRAAVGFADDPDSELVARWQSGDERAFEQLLRRHEKRVFRPLMRMMGTREEAEDVAQETFLSLYRHGHRFRGEALFSTFVYRVASNAALNRRRTLGRSRNRIKRLAVRQEAGDDLPSAPRNPEDAVSGGELSAHLHKALEVLQPALRMPVLLYDIEGLAYAEIAEVLGVAEGTVKSRIHRARQALRAELKGLLGGAKEGVVP
jgi:RNA polymerase sigma-70 factor (ECF subfamily)